MKIFADDELIKDAANYYAKVLEIDRYNIYISKVSKIIHESNVPNIRGVAYPPDDNDNVFIFITDNYDMLQTLAHEFVHVKQYARNELVVKDGQTIWQGALFSSDEYSIDDPWEVEAYSRECKLFLQFIIGY